VDKGRKVNVTLCFSVAQALLAAKAGATFVSPFMGRLEDSGNSGIDLVQEIAKVYYKHEVRTMILAASVRNVHHVVSAFRAGADIVTMSPAILYEMFKHPLTDRGLAIFAGDALKSGVHIE
jgi:transaldolase